MSETELEVRPEGAQEGTCRSCGKPVWWVVSTAGKPMPLDIAPDAEGNIEMVRIGQDWSAQVLAQVESLFEVPRPRWRPHVASCPQAGWCRRPRVPEPRQG